MVSQVHAQITRYVIFFSRRIFFMYINVKRKRNRKSRNSYRKTWKNDRKTRNKKNKQNKALKELKTTKKRIRRTKEKNKKKTLLIANIPKEILWTYFLRYVCQFIKKVKKEVSRKCIRITKILKDEMKKK